MKDVGKKPYLETGTYRHYKGSLYNVIYVACHSETLEWHVVYRSYEREQLKLPSIWVRPYDMFVELVELNGKMIPRFEKIDE